MPEVGDLRYLFNETSKMKDQRLFFYTQKLHQNRTKFKTSNFYKLRGVRYLTKITFSQRRTRHHVMPKKYSDFAYWVLS